MSYIRLRAIKTDSMRIALTKKAGSDTELDRAAYNLVMTPFRTLLERTAFHIPYSHDWLAERDALRNESRKLRETNERLGAELEAARLRLNELTRSLWQPPGHFYSPIPEVKDLQINRERVFGFPPSMPDIEFNESRQLELLDRFRLWYADQPFPDHRSPGNRYYFENDNFSYTDAIILYCMMRYLRPKRIIEVGSGFSSGAILDVNEKLFDNAIAVTLIDPYPELLQGLLTENDKSRTRILSTVVQDVGFDVFQTLQANDILFIDSSHVAKTGSDVTHLIFRILPLLKAGVYIHVHDIFYPFEYPERWVLEGRAWNEAYFIHAFLAYNNAYEIQFLFTYLLNRYSDRIEMEFPLFKKAVGGSLWLRKNGPDPPIHTEPGT